MYIRLAWRYATRRIVNYVAILAVALALTVQIVAMGILDGMLVDMERRVQNLGEQVTLRFKNDHPTAADLQKAADAVVKDLPGVRGITPLVQEVGFLQAAGHAEYVLVNGIDLSAELKYSGLPGFLLSYKPDPAMAEWYPAGMDRSLPGMFMGEELAKGLGVLPGNDVELLYADRDASGGMELRSRKFKVTSLFRSGSPGKDEYGVYVPLKEAADFYFAKNGAADPSALVQVFCAWLDDPQQADAMEAQILNKVVRTLGRNEADVFSNTWQRRWSNVSQAMKHENDLMELVLYLNNLAAGFCVFAILATLVSRRVRDVGLLRCLGMSRSGVITVFLLVGLFIGGAAATLGAFGGTFFCGPLSLEQNGGKWMFAAGGAAASPKAWEARNDVRPRIDRYYEDITGSPLYPPRMFGITSAAGLPIVIYPWKLALYVVVAVLVTIFAALYPAIWAAWREPVSSLRDE